MADDFLPLVEVTFKLGLSRWALYREVIEGRLPGRRQGRQWLVSLSAARAFKAKLARLSPTPAA